MLKEQILYELETHRDQPVSGQALADMFQVSRNAVWKVIKNLREEGYSISSTRNKGYVLESSSDVLSKEGIQAELQGMLPELELYLFDEIDSTNNEAKRMLASGFVGNALIAAETQTMGRGRSGKSFFSEGGGLYLSVILQTGQMDCRISMLTIVTACAVLRALERKTGAELQLKWVNDLFLGNRKVGGILSEAITDLESGKTEAVVIGIGINLNAAAFPKELETIAASIHTEVSRNALIAEIAKELFAADWGDPESELPFYREHSLVIGREVTYQNERVQAQAIDETGGLVIRYPDGREETIRGGSITI